MDIGVATIHVQNGLEKDFVVNLRSIFFIFSSNS